MQTERIVAKLERRYPELEQVGDAVFRGVDVYNGRPYAVRYFDLGDDVIAAAGRLQEYQDSLLGKSYFNEESKADLRWNHYLYFVTAKGRVDKPFLRAKATVESDREYARKIVVLEGELDGVLADRHFGSGSPEGLPTDPLSIWARTLEKHNLEFIVDETLQVPAVVRSIAGGEQRPVLRPPAPPQLDSAEKAVPGDSLANIAIQEFREYPVRKKFDFGAVNLILGVNGVGKTSLFEAIEYLFCGKTRRLGSVPRRTVVSGLLTESTLTFETRATTPPDRLRSRHLAWYGKAELRTMKLQDSFSKFNFLDTDAAVRLSVEKSRERIIDDLAQLLLGAEAAKTLSRFERVVRQLVESKKAIENDIVDRELRRSEAAGRLQSLREAPRESDSLFDDLLVGLNNAGWRQLPSDKRRTERLSASLQSALVSVVILKSGGDATPADCNQLDATLQSLADAEQVIDRLTKEEMARNRDDAQARQHLQQITRRMEAIDALAPIVQAGVRESYRQRQSLERQVNERTASLAEAEAAIGNLPAEQDLRQKMLSKAVAEWTEGVGAVRDRVNAAKRAVATFERTQTALSSLRQRLRSSAEEIIRHTGKTTQCPLCEAEYSEAELDKRIEEVTQGVVPVESDRLRSELQAADTLHQQRVSELTALRVLERYLQEDSAKTSLDAAIRLVTSARDLVVGLMAELNAVKDTLRVQEEKGWTFERLIELASTAGIAKSEISSDRIEGMRTVIRDEQRSLLGTVNGLEAEARRARARAAEIGLTYGLRNPTLPEVARVVSERRRAAEDRRRAIAALRDQLDLESADAASELEARLREAQGLAGRLRTAVAREEQDTEAIERESKMVRDAKAEIEGLRVRLRRVDSAASVLKEMLSQQSERVLAETVLRENAANIASTFARIHAPNEFDLEVVDDGLNIVRRGGGSVDLDEMSSGQRAAYALSLFLAMNERLSSGPRVLLLDDPVAHVDDINTLSLLDHLRDIALSGERQIFFATADSKIGALFARKFRFLGDRFVEIELTRE